MVESAFQIVVGDKQIVADYTYFGYVFLVVFHIVVVQNLEFAVAADTSAGLAASDTAVDSETASVVVAYTVAVA